MKIVVSEFLTFREADRVLETLVGALDGTAALDGPARLELVSQASASRVSRRSPRSSMRPTSATSASRHPKPLV